MTALRSLLFACSLLCASPLVFAQAKGGLPDMARSIDEVRGKTGSTIQFRVTAKSWIIDGKGPSLSGVKFFSGGGGKGNRARLSEAVPGFPSGLFPPKRGRLPLSSGWVVMAMSAFSAAEEKRASE